jgi:hypothetical protein
VRCWHFRRAQSCNGRFLRVQKIYKQCEKLSSPSPALLVHLNLLLGRVCEGGPRARLRSWAATYRVCGVDPRGGLALLAWPSRNAGNLRFSRARLARSACWLAWARNGDGITSDWARAWVTMAGGGFVAGGKEW